MDLDLQRALQTLEERRRVQKYPTPLENILELLNPGLVNMPMPNPADVARAVVQQMQQIGMAKSAQEYLNALRQEDWQKMSLEQFVADNS